MTRDEVFQQVREVVSTTLRVPADKVLPDSRLAEDLDADSLFVTQLSLELEEKFEITVNDEDMPKLTTIDAVVDYVTEQLGGR